MDREQTLDWLYRLRSVLYIFMPKKWVIPMNDALNEAIKALQSAEPKIVPVAYIHFDEDKMRKICAEVAENIEVKQDWIPVSEMLPEESGQYLITVKYKHVDNYEDIYAEHGEWNGSKWDMFMFGHCGEVESILAWMPLPKPYDPQESEG